MKKGLKIFTLVVACATLLLGLGITVPVIYDDIQFNRYAGAVVDEMKQGGISTVQLKKDIGILFGNGNHLDMEVLAFIKTTLSPKELAAYLSASKIESPFDRSNHFSLYKVDPSGVSVYFVGTNSWEKPEGLETREQEAIAGVHSDFDYVVSYVDQAYDGFSMYDYRAN